LNTINETRDKITGLRIDLQVGKIFSSLGHAVGRVIDSTKRNQAVTPVVVPDDNDGIQELLTEIQEELGQGEMDGISDEKLNQLLNHLGSKNPAIRDKGVFYLFNDLIQNQVPTKKQLVMVFDRLLQDDMLLSHIEEKENDAAYLRSFSIMLLATLVYIDRAGEGFIDYERKNRLVDQLALYIVLENDTRGYVEQYGWIHAYTHIGNILDELATDKDLIRADKILLMAILLEKFRRLHTPLVYGEVARIAGYFADQLMEDDVYQQFLLIELREWRRSLAMAQVRETKGMWDAIFNRQRLLQAMVIHPDMASAVIEYLEDSNDFTI
jgi:hypothetical protein